MPVTCGKDPPGRAICEQRGLRGTGEGQASRQPRGQRKSSQGWLSPQQLGDGVGVGAGLPHWRAGQALGGDLCPSLHTQFQLLLVPTWPGLRGTSG